MIKDKKLKLIKDFEANQPYLSKFKIIGNLIEYTG